MAVHMEQARKIELMTLARERGVTLNGNPAHVEGYRHEFAKVTDVTTRLSAEWSWQAVERVVTTHGKFES